jgi:hypothetical protein
MTGKRAVLLVLAMVAGFGITAWFVARSQVPTVMGAFESQESRTALSTALTAGYGFAITLIGVALGAAYRRLIRMRAEGEDKVLVGKLVREVSGSIDFLIGLVGSPIVFGLLWKALADVSLPGLTLIALQNGFASHAILDQAIDGRGRPRGRNQRKVPEQPAPPGPASKRRP